MGKRYSITYLISPHSPLLPNWTVSILTFPVYSVSCHPVQDFSLSIMPCFPYSGPYILPAQITPEDIQFQLVFSSQKQWKQKSIGSCIEWFFPPNFPRWVLLWERKAKYIESKEYDGYMCIYIFFHFQKHWFSSDFSSASREKSGL